MSQAYDTMDAVFSARFSCRAFKPDPVPRADIERIVALARRAPSWCNAQPWQLVITSGNETDAFRTALQAEIAQASNSPDIPFPEKYSGIYQDRRRTCGFQLYNAVGIDRGDRQGRADQMMRNFALFDAPHVAIVSSPAELGPYGAMDCGGFVTAFTTAAQALGIATIPQAAIASYAPFVHRHFEIGEDRLILCAISFGYADMDDPANAFRTDRAEVADIVDWRG
ncbi:nitroreductase [Aestuariivita boseongensis]|uniref:nitroreductase n=1 Tax=Aestuariivita boseongensis TaxID=1470562 RepID=UPI0006811CE3|nr:nitroreductase [Aestuariivita boseongensis]